MNHIKNISFIFLAIFIIGSLLQSCAAPGRVNYGVNVHYRPGWSHGHYNHRNYYHHRPTVRLNVRTGHGRRSPRR